MTPSRDTGDDDGPLLAEFGYTQELPRVLGFWTTWALGFAFISPIVGLYTIFSLATQTVGPTWFWAVVIVILGQLLVALVYAQLAAKWPITGGIYQWSRLALGKKYGWWAGWIYLWALTITVATVAYGGGNFLTLLVTGSNDPQPLHTILAAFAALVIMTIVTYVSINTLKWVLYLGILCSILAMLPISLTLLVLHRSQSFSVLLDTTMIPSGATFFTSFVSAVAIGGWVLLGFDACCSLAEEVRSPTKQIPKAVVASLIAVGLIDLLGAAAILLAAPDLGPYIDGTGGDPIYNVIAYALGDGVAQVFLVIVVVAFIACGVAVQATAVRVIFSYSRDNMFPFSRVWRTLHPRVKSPMNATLLTFAVCAGLLLWANALAILVSFATAAYYLAFLAPVAAVLLLRVRRQWQPTGPWAMPRTGVYVNTFAFLWLVFELINISLPRDQGLPWWQEWAVAIGFLICFTAGATYFKVYRPYERVPLDQRAPAKATTDVFKHRGQ